MLPVSYVVLSDLLFFNFLSMLLLSILSHSFDILSLEITKQFLSLVVINRFGHNHGYIYEDKYKNTSLEGATNKILNFVVKAKVSEQNHVIIEKHNH